MPEAANDIDAQASEWAVRVAEGTLTSAETAYLEQWLSADSRHRGAFVRAQAGWRALGRIAQTQGHVTPAAAPAPAAEQTPPARFQPTRRMVIMSAAATGIAATGVGALLLTRRSLTYASGVGEVRRVVLSDGSSATIGSRATIEVAMRQEQRTLRVEGGEAWFDVAPNTQRPFVVSAGDVRVRAVGTAFSVGQMSDGVEVLVSEGIVEAWQGDGAHRRVTAGQQIRFVQAATTHPDPITIGEDQVARRLAWRSGLVILDGEPLGAAAERFNRYNVDQIEIADPSLAAIRLTGRFKASEALAFARAAGTVANARVSHADGQIILSR
jgi:transmembrane sensor